MPPTLIFFATKLKTENETDKGQFFLKSLRAYLDNVPFLGLIGTRTVPVILFILSRPLKILLIARDGKLLQYIPVYDGSGLSTYYA